jgi:hypothetical protein
MCSTGNESCQAQVQVLIPTQVDDKGSEFVFYLLVLGRTKPLVRTFMNN